MSGDPNILGEEFWNTQRRIIEASSPPDPNHLSEEECHHYNAIRMRLLLDEIVKAKKANKHVLAADLSCLMADLTVDFRNLMIMTVPEYNLHRTNAERMSAAFGTHKPTFPEDN